MESQEQYILCKIADSLIHHKMSDFSQSSYPARVKNENLYIGRVICFFIILVAFVLQLLSKNVSLPLSLITDIELYTTSSCLVALFYSHYAAKVPHDKTPSAKDIVTKRNAVIWNSIAITINLVVLITFFIFIPITMASDGKFTAGYFFTI